MVFGVDDRLQIIFKKANDFD